MALPIIMFFFLVVIAVALFVFGYTRATIGAGFSFTALSGVFLILTGLLLWTGGLQLDSTATLTTAGAVTTISYETMTFAANPEIMLLSYFFVFGGFFPIILSFKNVVSFNKAEAEAAADADY